MARTVPAITKYRVYDDETYTCREAIARAHMPTGTHTYCGVGGGQKRKPYGYPREIDRDSLEGDIVSGRSIAPPTQCMIYGRQNAEREGEGEGDQCSRVSHPVPSCTEKQVRSLGCTEVIDVTLRSVRYGVYRVALLGCTCRSHGGHHGVSRCSYSGAILKL